MNGLPREAAAWRGDAEVTWTTQDELSAALLELTDRWGRQIVVALGIKKDRLGPPLRVPRPGSEPEQSAKAMSVADFVKSHHAHKRG